MIKALFLASLLLGGVACPLGTVVMPAKEVLEQRISSVLSDDFIDKMSFAQGLAQGLANQEYDIFDIEIIVESALLDYNDENGKNCMSEDFMHKTQSLLLKSILKHRYPPQE